MFLAIYPNFLPWAPGGGVAIPGPGVFFSVREKERRREKEREKERERRRLKKKKGGGMGFMAKRSPPFFLGQAGFERIGRGFLS